MDLPVSPPVASIATSALGCGWTPEQIHVAFGVIKSRLASTSFKSAKASEVCGLLRLEMADGKIAYTDKTGRYFILGLLLDTKTGSPADASIQVDRQPSNIQGN